MNISDWVESDILCYWPNWAFALVVLMLGWCSAVIIRWLLPKIFQVVRFNRICDRTGFSEFLKKGQVVYTPAQLMGVVAYWIILLIVLIQSARLINLRLIEKISERMTEFVPGIITACLIVSVGAILVAFLGNFVMTVARNAAYPYAVPLVRIIKAVGWIIILTLTVEQLKVGTTLITSMCLILLFGVVLGLALAFGLGCKDIARNAMERYLHNLREKERMRSNSDMEG